MDHTKGLFIDIDGVLLEDGRPISGSVAHFNELKKHYKVRLLTNTTTKTAHDIHQLMTDLGFDVLQEEIITAPVAAQLFIKQKEYTRVYPVVNVRILSEFDEFKVSQDTPEVLVVGDIGNQWTYDLLNQMFKCMMGGAELIALHKGKFWKSEGDLQMDIGGFVAGLEYATGKTATVIGKPSHSFFSAALKSIELTKDEVLMIGDDIDGDIGGAQRFWTEGLLSENWKIQRGVC